MILQQKLTLTAEPPADRAYALYAWLLTKLPTDAAARLHQSEQAVAQHLHKSEWTLSLTGDLADKVSEALDAAEEVVVNDTVLGITSRKKTVVTAEALLQNAPSSPLAKMELLSPTAFRQAGRYTFFPTERLIVQSLLMKWNRFAPDRAFPLEEVLTPLSDGISIEDHDLRTLRFHLKETDIPSFVGSLRLKARLPKDLLSLWNTLLAFAPYCGIGIKTTLGMGGVQTEFEA